MSETLADVLADERAQAKILHGKGFVREAQMLEKVLDRIADAAEEFLRWLSESEAQLQSGLSQQTLRRRFRDWYDSGVARYDRRGQREYLQAVVPHRPNIAAARERGRRSALPPTS